MQYLIQIANMPNLQTNNLGTPHSNYPQKVRGQKQAKKIRSETIEYNRYEFHQASESQEEDIIQQIEREMGDHMKRLIIREDMLNKDEMAMTDKNEELKRRQEKLKNEEMEVADQKKKLEIREDRLNRDEMAMAEAKKDLKKRQDKLKNEEMEVADKMKKIKIREDTLNRDKMAMTDKNEELKKRQEKLKNEEIMMREQRLTAEIKREQIQKEKMKMAEQKRKEQLKQRKNNLLNQLKQYQTDRKQYFLMMIKERKPEPRDELKMAINWIDAKIIPIKAEIKEIQSEIFKPRHQYKIDEQLFH